MSEESPDTPLMHPVPNTEEGPRQRAHPHDRVTTTSVEDHGRGPLDVTVPAEAPHPSGRADPAESMRLFLTFSQPSFYEGPLSEISAAGQSPKLSNASVRDRPQETQMYVYSSMVLHGCRREAD